jgi:hypothetical protein
VYVGGPLARVRTHCLYDLAVLDALADDAGGCTVMVHAALLAGWIGAGRAVTPKGVLRPVDVPSAAEELGVEVPQRIRTAADVPVIHHPWVAAQAIGLISVDGGCARATSAPVEDQLQAWWTALLAVLTEESGDRRGEGAVVLCRALLTALAGEPPPPHDRLDEVVHHLLHHAELEQATAVYEAFRRGVMPVDGGLEVLGEFGAVDARGRLTSLGRWAGARFAAVVPQPVTPDLPAADLLVRLAVSPEEVAWRLACRWLQGKDADQAVAEVFSAAEAATPAARVAGIDLVGGLGEAARPAWEAVLDRPMLAPHARAVLATWDGPDEEPETSEADQCWLAVEYALAAEDPEEAYHLVQDFGGMSVVEASSHPGAAGLRRSLALAGRPARRVYQMKIVLSGFRPTVWRRLRLPATITLDVLHYVIQAAFDWDDDHLHVFEADHRRYADAGLEDCGDESGVRLLKVLPRRGATMTYVYDLGDCWEHRITLEQIDEPEVADEMPAAVCIGGSGDAPVEDWNPEDGPAVTPFDIEAINRRLPAITR